jgi:hypothetical protein
MTKKKWIQTYRLNNIRLVSIGFIFCGLLIACTENDSQSISSLSDVIRSFDASQLDEVIACAASAEEDSSVSYIYYYPIPDARNIQYFETSSTDINPDDYQNYQLKSLDTEDVFGGYLKRFVRTGMDEVYSIVTFELNGKLHKSNPIRLKQSSKPTEYQTQTTIDTSETLMPRFSWEDGTIPENAIYFQVISDQNNQFISGTYTFDLWFQYYKLSNVVLNINREVPQELISGEAYNFSMLAVSLDNWVNLVIEKPFTAQ